MAVGLRAAATFGDGQSAAVSSLTVTVPSAGTTSGGGSNPVVAGDYAFIAAQVVSTSATLTTPTGWTVVDGPRRGSRTSTWVFGKTLVSGDIGANVSLAFSASVRCDAVVVVASTVGTTATGIVNTETVETSRPTLGTQSGVASGAFLLAILLRSHTATTAPALGLPSGYAAVAPQTSTAYSSSPQQAILAGWQAAPSSGSYNGSGSSSPSSSGINYLLVLPAGLPANSPATAPGATAQVTASAAAGDATGTAAPRPYAGSQTWPPAPYTQVWRSGNMRVVYSASAFLAGAPVNGALDMTPLGGTVTDTVKPGVRRVLSLDLPPDPDVYDAISPLGTQLTVTAHVSANSVPVVDIPMGVFVVDPQSITEGNGKMTITAPDQWSNIQRARFINPAISSPGMRVVDQIALLIQGAIPGQQVTVTASSQATVGALTWDKDRDKAILELAESIGAWVYFDRSGAATVADIPTLGANVAWTVDAGENGVQVSLDRQKARTGVANVVVVSSGSATAAAFSPIAVWDTDPGSPTYAGPDPINNPSGAGPFGVVPVFYSSPILADFGAAIQAGKAILAQAIGLASSVSLSAVPNPAMDAMDAIDVLPPGQRAVGVRTVGGLPVPILQGTGVMERHLIDTVTHPLTIADGSPLQIQGRSTRIDPYTSDVTG